MADLWRIVSGPGSRELAAAITAQTPVALQIEIYDRYETRRSVWVVFVSAACRQKTVIWDVRSFNLYDTMAKKKLVGRGGTGDYDAACADGRPIKQKYVGRLHLDKA